MRKFQIGLVIVLGALAIYMYVVNPAGCTKLFHDSKNVVFSLWSPQPPPETATNEVASVVAPPAAPVKLWAPLTVMPAQPNWTWSTLDGKTYDSVVVSKIEAEDVTINHDKGTAHIPMKLLPADIQQKLNYDPAAAAAAHAEREREAAHPYYRMDARAEAQAVAQKMHWPLAWVSSFKEYILPSNPLHNEDADMTILALNHLKDKAIIIFIDVGNEIGETPENIHHQFSKKDDGALAGSANYRAPKIVFSNADASKILGRVPYAKMKQRGEGAIDQVLDDISKGVDPIAQSNASTLNSPDTSTSAADSPVSVSTPADSSATVTSSAADAPPDAPKSTTAPDGIPVQPNWTWTTLDGKTYNDVVVSKIEVDSVTFNHSMGTAHVSMKLLPDDIQKALHYDPHAAIPIAALIDGKLVSADGTEARTPGTSVQYYAIYYSAKWHPPSHTFSPKLVAWYNKFKPVHHDFELIFVSEDNSETAMFDYMKEMAMPWPAVRYTELKHDGNHTFRSSGIEKFAGEGIPDLVLVDAGGTVLADSYQGSHYVGPEVVVDTINKLVGGSSPVPLAGQNLPSGNKSILVSTQN